MRKIVFIGGCPRSGTTTLAAMLGNSPSTATVPEGPFKFILLSELRGKQTAENTRITLRKALNHYSFKNWEIKVDADELLEKVDFSADLFPQLYNLLITAYLKSYWPEKAVHWVVDHDPSNCKFASALSAYFADSVYIHLIRDGRAVAASIMPLDWGPNDIVSSTIFWLTNLSYGFAAEAKFVNSSRIRYEDLVLQAEKEMQQLCNQISIPFASSMLVPAGLRVPNYTKDQHQLVGKPLVAGRVNAWETTLSESEIYLFQKETFEMLSILGYELKDINTKISSIDKLRFKFGGMVKNYLNISRKKKREAGV